MNALNTNATQSLSEITDAELPELSGNELMAIGGGADAIANV